MTQKACTLLATFLLWAVAAHGEDAAQSVRLRFVPVDTHGECGAGAHFTRLCPAPGRPGALFAIVHAGLRDKFPIKDQDGRVVFRVTVPEATDERFVLEIKAETGSQKIDLPRDKPVTIEVAGARFEFYYPTSHVSSEGKTTTNKALLIVTRVPQRENNSRRLGQGGEPKAEQQRRDEHSSAHAPEDISR